MGSGRGILIIWLGTAVKKFQFRSPNKRVKLGGSGQFIQIKEDRAVSTIEEIEKLTKIAEANGFQVRHEYFGGTGGGLCEFGGKRVLFLDLALSSTEQLETLKQSLDEFIR